MKTIYFLIDGIESHVTDCSNFRAKFVEFRFGMRSTELKEIFNRTISWTKIRIRSILRELKLFGELVHDENQSSRRTFGSKEILKTRTKISLMSNISERVSQKLRLSPDENPIEPTGFGGRAFDEFWRLLIKYDHRQYLSINLCPNDPLHRMRRDIFLVWWKSTKNLLNRGVIREIFE